MYQLSSCSSGEILEVFLKNSLMGCCTWKRKVVDAWDYQEKVYRNIEKDHHRHSTLEAESTYENGAFL